MQLIKTILVKQVITENSKQILHQKFASEMKQLDRECQQLLFEQRKLTNKLGVSKQDIGKRFDTEIDHRKNKMAVLDFKIEQLDILEIGSEIIEKEMEGLIQIEVGDNWNQINTNQAIIIKDDIIIRIDRE